MSIGLKMAAQRARVIAQECPNKKITWDEIENIWREIAVISETGDRILDKLKELQKQ